MSQYILALFCKISLTWIYFILFENMLQHVNLGLSDQRPSIQWPTYLVELRVLGMHPPSTGCCNDFLFAIVHSCLLIVYLQYYQTFQGLAMSTFQVVLLPTVVGGNSIKSNFCLSWYLCRNFVDSLVQVIVFISLLHACSVGKWILPQIH